MIRDPDRLLVLVGLALAAAILVLLCTDGRACPPDSAYETGRPVILEAGCLAPAGVWRSAEAHRDREAATAAIVAERDQLRVDLASLQSRYLHAREATAAMLLELSRDLRLARDALAVQPCVCDCPTVGVGAAACVACGLGGAVLGFRFAE